MCRGQRYLLVCLMVFVCIGKVVADEGIYYDVREYGARGDGKTVCTEAIQRAIDAAGAAGGGRVYVPAGIFVSGTIELRSGVELYLAAGAVLRGSRKLEHYRPKVPAFRSYTDNYTERSLIYAEGAERIAITGRGVIDGRGAAFKGPYKVRPYLMRFVQCRDVVVEGVTIVDSPMWVQHYLGCDSVRIRGIRVRSNVNHNNDGIDIDCCRRVIITGCDIDSGDDAIVLKSTAGRVCRDVVVADCVLRSRCNALKMGTESNGGFENIVLDSCVIYDTRLAGVALEIVDGGTMDRVVVSDISMDGVGTPIFIRLGNRARPYKKDMPQPGVGKLRNVTICDIEARRAGSIGCAITGIPQAKIENVTLRGLRLLFAGGGSKEEARRQVPEKAEAYPEFSMFGRLPAYGFYCRHVRGLRMRDVQLRWDKPDMRCAVVCEDVQALVVDGLDAACDPRGCAVMRLSGVNDAVIRGCRAEGAGEVFLSVEGGSSGGIVLSGNDLRAVEKAVAYGQGVSKQAVSVLGNYMR